MREGGQILSHVEISPMGDTLGHMRTEAERALYGNRSCSLENMNTTCFAAEFCALSDGRAPSIPSASSFDMQSVMTLVAHSRRSDDSNRTAATDHFVGCVCVGHADIYGRAAYPPNLDISNAHVIFNLCVSSTFQGGGVGRQLIDAVRQRINGPLYLFVLKTGSESSKSDIMSTMRTRVARLRTTYSRLGLKRITDTSQTVLFEVA